MGFKRQGNHMRLLKIDFQEGFVDDTVVVAVNGREVGRQEGLRTRTQIGYAGSMELEVEPGPTTVGLRVPGKDLAADVPVDAAGDVYLGVSLSPERGIECRVSQRPFGYL